MCHNNYSKEKKKYKHLIYAERTMIERWYNRDHLSKKEIAKNLDKSERTIRREIKRGLTTNLNTYLEEIEVYSADIAQKVYELTKAGLLEITARTIRNYIYDGNVFDLTENDMIYNKQHKSKNNNKKIANILHQKKV